MIAVILVPTEPVAFSVAFVLLPLEIDRKDNGLKISGDKIFLKIFVLFQYFLLAERK